MKQNVGIAERQAGNLKQMAAFFVADAAFYEKRGSSLHGRSLSSL